MPLCCNQSISICNLLVLEERHIGLIRLILKRSGDELKEILDEFLSDIPDTLDSGLDLSDLDELTPD